MKKRNLYLVPVRPAGPVQALEQLRETLLHSVQTLWGVGLSIDLVSRQQPNILLLFVSLAVFWFNPIPLAMGFFLLSPPWAYPFLNVPSSMARDSIADYRTMPAIAGWAWILAAVLPLELTWFLILGWALQSFSRTRFYQTEANFWRQALYENPSNPRARINLNEALKSTFFKHRFGPEKNLEKAMAAAAELQILDPNINLNISTEL